MKELDSRRSALEQKVATATAQFGPRWPEVQALRRELEDVRQQLANEQRKALEQAQVEYNLAVAHRERLLAALAAQNRLADQLTQDSIQFNVLKREVETDRQMHDGLLQRMKETDVSSGLKPANVHVLDRGSVPTVPSSPNIPLNLAMGLMLGLMSGVALAVAAEFFDHTVKTSDDVELDLQLPCLGAIPAFDKSWKEASGGLLMPLNARGAHPSRAYLTTGDTYWESYRALRTSGPVVLVRRKVPHHSHRVRSPGRRQEHHDRQPRNRARADRLADGDRRTGHATAEAVQHASHISHARAQSLPFGAMRTEHGDSRDRDSEPVSSCRRVRCRGILRS